MRDRVILAALLYHGMRREELCGLRVKDMQSRQGVVHFRVRGKRDKDQVRSRACHGAAADRGVPGRRRPRRRCRRPVFRPLTNNRTGELDRPLDPASVYRNIVLKYGLETGISAEVNGLCVHSLRATAATNALSHEAGYRQGPGVARARQCVHRASL